MPKTKILRPYKYSPNGIDIVRVAAGEAPDIPEPFYTSAIELGFAEKVPTIQRKKMAQRKKTAVTD